MKTFKFIFCIIIILFQTGNVLSNNNIFNVNNIVINKENSKNTTELVNEAFQKAFNDLTERLLLDDDIRRLSSINLSQIKKLISYYQIINTDHNNLKENEIKVNVFFDKDRMHNFFNIRNILYSDVFNAEVILFPLLVKKNNIFIYNNNYFYENWNKDVSDNLIQYSLPVENIENIQKININKDDIYNLNISDFFKEHKDDNVVFANILINDDTAEIFLNTRIENKKIIKTISISKNNNELTEKQFYKKIILETNQTIRNLIKLQNLIDVRTPSFLNVEIKIDKKNSLIEFNNRVKNIYLIDSFFVQELKKDNILIKIKYLGKINKIISRLKKANIDLKLSEGQWQLNII